MTSIWETTVHLDKPVLKGFCLRMLSNLKTKIKPCFDFWFTCILKLSIAYTIFHSIWYHHPTFNICTWKKLSIIHFWILFFFLNRFDSCSSLGTDTVRYHKATFNLMFLKLKLKILIKIYHLKVSIRSTAYINDYLFVNRKGISETEGFTTFKQKQLEYNCADCKYLPSLSCSS